MSSSVAKQSLRTTNKKRLHVQRLQEQRRIFFLPHYLSAFLININKTCAQNKKLNVLNCHSIDPGAVQRAGTMCHSKAGIKLAHTSHPVGPIWGNKGHNKTLLPSRSVLGHVYSIALSRLKLISASFAITRPRWPRAPRVCLQPVVEK